ADQPGAAPGQAAPGGFEARRRPGAAGGDPVAAGGDPVAGPGARTGPRPAVLAAAALLQFAIVAGLPDKAVLAVRRQAVDALELGAAERHQLDDAVRLFAAHRPDPPTVRLRFLRLGAAEQQGVTDLLVAATGGNGTLEESDMDLLGRLFAVLGAAEDELPRRVAELEVASVAIDGASVTALDTEAVAGILAAAPGLLPTLEALLAPWAGGPPPGYGAESANPWTAWAAGPASEPAGR
ncbi:MAG TPA: hypothetical protein VNV66_00950, partial [Pilimelia sp.]|nr:hypothetical protein [Pilimelia sp.]